MDTIYSQSSHERFLILCANIVLATSFVFSQNSFVFADNIKIVNGIVSTPLINSIRIERSIEKIETELSTEADFNNYIQKKYTNCKIYNVDKGIKHGKRKQ